MNARITSIGRPGVFIGTFQGALTAETASFRCLGGNLSLQLEDAPVQLLVPLQYPLMLPEKALV